MKKLFLTVLAFAVLGSAVFAECNCKNGCTCQKVVTKNCTCPVCETVKKQVEDCNCDKCATKKDCSCSKCEKAKAQLNNCKCPQCTENGCTCSKCEKAKKQIEKCDCDKCSTTKECTCPKCKK